MRPSTSKFLGKLLLAALTSTPLAASAQVNLPGLALERAFPRVEIPAPIRLRTVPDGSGDLMVLSLPGFLWRLPGTADPEPNSLSQVLNLQALIGTESQDMGSYDFAFDPDFANNSVVYVTYANADSSQTLTRFTLGGSPMDAQATADVILTAPPTGQPLQHFGSTIQFGPQDGYLYWSTSDGHNPTGPQDPDSLLGKILRIDVTTQTDGLTPYVIPADNPFVGYAAWRPEVWALGLRNPFRFSFDAPTGRLFVGDPGDNVMEEVDIIGKGGNYGWPILEGTACYGDNVKCDRVDLIAPLHTYDPPGRQAMIGGYVYRGSAIPALQGTYVFGDFISGNVVGLALEGDTVLGEAVLLESSVPALASMSADAAGELYIHDLATGGVYRLVSASTDSTGESWQVK